MSQVITLNGDHVVDQPEDAIYIVESGTLTVVDGGALAMLPTFSNPYIVWLAGGTLSITGGSIGGGSANNAPSGPTILLDRGTLIMTGGSVTGGAGGTQGGAAMAGTGNAFTLKISGGSVTGGSGGNTGGNAIMFEQQPPQSSTIEISGGTIAGGHGGNVGGTAITGTNIGALGTSVRAATISGGTIQAGSGSNVAGQCLNVKCLLGGLLFVISGGTFDGAWQLATTIDFGGIVEVSGTGLTILNGRLKGTLTDGSAIDVPVIDANSNEIKLT